MRRSTFQFISAFALLIAVTALIGCDTIGVDEADDGSDGGTLRVELVDAPGDILEANVTITRVAIVPTEDSADGEAEEGGIEVLADDSITVDLVRLQNGVSETLGEIEIPEGTYSQIRFITAREASVYYEDANGERQQAELKLPSADETGIKVNFDAFTIDDRADSVEVTLDFNVEESFVRAGQSGMYIFKPVVQAESVVDLDDESDEDDTGSGDGTESG